MKIEEEGTVRGRLAALVAGILGTQAAVSADTPLVDQGMSSINMVRLMLAVEAEFGIAIPPAQITPQNFRSIVSMEALVQGLLAG